MSLTDAIPETIKEIGRIKAQGQAGRGAYGHALADIGQMAASIPGQVRANRQADQVDALRGQQLQRGAQDLQAGDLDLQAKRRQAAADQAIQNAMSAALNPDGTVDAAKLTQHLAGTPAASALPEILQHLTAMQKSTVDLKLASTNLDDAERDEMGALAAAAEAAGTDPETQASILLTGIASRVKRQRMSNADANPIIAGLLGDDGAPNPTGVKSTLARMKAASKEQRVLDASDSQKEASTEDAKARAAARKEATDQKTLQDALSNLSRQLARTGTNKAQYTQVFRGVPTQYQSYFDAPENWTTDSAERAADVMLTADQRQSKRHDQALETDAVARREETASHNRALEDAATVRADSTIDRKQAEQHKRYDEFTKVWEAAYPKPTAAELALADPTKPLPPPPPAPPTFEKWSVMTQAERQAVLKNPNARINDAEMTRRAGAAPAVAAATAAPPPPAASGKPTAPDVKKTVTEAELKQSAKVLGISVDAARKQAIAEGFTVAP